jgi:hypothetical protein
MKRRFSFPKRKLALFITLIIVVGLGFFLFKKIQSPRQKQFQPFQKTTVVERKWDFVASDKTGVPLETKITFSLISAQKTNQIYVKGKPVRTTPENAFLVLSLELKNDAQERLYFYSSDLIRLLSKDDKKFEADFKNPRLEIAPLSTKKDKLVFLVSASQNNFQIQVGEITGEKETININF